MQKFIYHSQLTNDISKYISVGYRIFWISSKCNRIGKCTAKWVNNFKTAQMDPVNLVNESVANKMQDR